MSVKKQINTFSPAPAVSPLNRLCAVPLSGRKAVLERTHDRLVRLCGHADCQPSGQERENAGSVAPLAAMPELLLAIMPAATPLLQ